MPLPLLFWVRSQYIAQAGLLYLLRHRETLPCLPLYAGLEQRWKGCCIYCLKVDLYLRVIKSDSYFIVYSQILTK